MVGEFPKRVEKVCVFLGRSSDKPPSVVLVHVDVHLVVVHATVRGGRAVAQRSPVAIVITSTAAAVAVPVVGVVVVLGGIGRLEGVARAGEQQAVVAATVYSG